MNSIAPYIVLVLLLLVFIAPVFYFMARKYKQRKGQDGVRIAELQRAVEKLKARRMTASGGLSRETRDALGDIIAKIDMMSDPLDELKARQEDLRRDAINLMNKKEKR